MIINKEKNGFSLTRDDFEIEWFSGSGGGGSHRNKTQNCCRLIHRDSKVIKLGTSERSREANRKHAFLELTNDYRFRRWLNDKIREITTGKTIEQIVDEQMHVDNLKFEIQDENGKWIEVKENEIVETPLTLTTTTVQYQKK